MSDRFRDRRVFAVVAVVFAVTTWLNWTTQTQVEAPQLTTVAMVEQIQGR